MSWIKFSNYKKRILDIKYDGVKVHLVITAFDSPSLAAKVAWSSDRFPNHSFYFYSKPYSRGTIPGLFRQIRRSLSYSFNPEAQEVMLRLSGGREQDYYYKKQIRGNRRNM